MINVAVVGIEVCVPVFRKQTIVIQKATITIFKVLDCKCGRGQQKQE